MIRRHTLARIGLVVGLLVSGATGIACDREDRADLREGVNDADKEIDKLDSDGKDD
ncbi:MAG: hypothetical protein M3238_04150 [Actinomycetota bacterium]|nr:hypothetical protein [Actinomycetota bacterium]